METEEVYNVATIGIDQIAFTGDMNIDPALKTKIDDYIMDLYKTTDDVGNAQKAIDIAIDSINLISTNSNITSDLKSQIEEWATNLFIKAGENVKTAEAISVGV